MENCKADYSAYEFKVIKMLRIDSGVRVYLEGVVVVSRIFEKTVERIEHLVGK